MRKARTDTDTVRGVGKRKFKFKFKPQMKGSGKREAGPDKKQYRQKPTCAMKACTLQINLYCNENGTVDAYMTDRGTSPNTANTKCWRVLCVLVQLQYCIWDPTGR